jgi:hypothetical protein
MNDHFCQEDEKVSHVKNAMLGGGGTFLKKKLREPLMTHMVKVPQARWLSFSVLSEILASH